MTGPTYGDATALNGIPYYYVVTSVGATAGTHSADLLAAWRQQYFGTTANTDDAANDADPDADGRANLFEYALGTVPNVVDAGPVVALGQSGGFLTLTFAHIADASLVYEIKTSNDLPGAWTPAHTYPAFGAAGTEVYTDTVALGSIPRRFLRFQVTRP